MHLSFIIIQEEVTEEICQYKPNECALKCETATMDPAQVCKKIP